KVLGDGASRTQTQSAFARPLTPQYASPEQVRCLPMTTASDIYSLGAVFYELLTSRAAQPLALGASPAEIERVICDVYPPPARTIAPDLDADLDNIIRLAMRKEPDRRYRSVDHFAEDIRRHLESLPVLAHKDSTWYRLAKFAKRQRYPLAAAGLI